MEIEKQKKEKDKEKERRKTILICTAIPLTPLCVCASIVAPIAIVYNQKGGEVSTDTKLYLVNEKPSLSKYTWQGNVEFKFDETTLPTFWPGKGKRTAFAEIKTITADTEIILSSNEVEVGEEGYVYVPIALNKVPDSAAGTTFDLHCQITLMFRDKNQKLAQKTFDVYPSCYIATEEDKAKIVTESALNIEIIEGDKTVTGIIEGTDLTKKTAITIPANCNVESLQVIGTDGDLPSNIKTIIFTAPTESTDVDGLACWYKVRNGALNGTSIDTIVFDDYKNKNMIGFEDYALDDNYDYESGKGTHTNIKNIDISSWSFATIKNIDKYAGGYIGQPFYELTEANFVWPSCKDQMQFKSGIYRIFSSGGLNNTLLANAGMSPTITIEEHFKFASFGEGNKIIIGTDEQQSWTDSTVYIPAGTTDILPFAFQEYINDKYQSSFPECVQSIDFKNVSTINSIGYCTFQDSVITKIENFPQVTGGCALCLYYAGDGVKLDPHNTHIKYISVAEGVTSIPYCAFGMTEHVTTVNLPDSVKNIGEGAFYCTGYGVYRLTSDEIPLVPFTIHWPANLTSIDDYAFYGANLGYIKFPKTLETIGNYAFAGRDKTEYYSDYFSDALWCLDFSEIDSIAQIPSGWKSQNIFKYHWNTAVPKNVITKENSGQTTELSNWLLTNGSFNGPSGTYYSQYMVYVNLITLTEEDIEWNTTAKPGEAIIYGAHPKQTNFVRTLYKLNVPATYNGLPVTEIHDYAFNFTSGSIPLYSVNLDNATNLTTIGGGAFVGQKYLVGEINLPDTIKFVGGYAFQYSNLQVVRLNASPDGCVYGTSCFQYSEYLGRIELANNKSMGNIELNQNSFFRCQSLQYLELSPKITKIERNAFQQCCNLWYFNLHDFTSTDPIPSEWDPNAFDLSFMYIRGYHVPWDSYNGISSTPMYGMVSMNKDCTNLFNSFNEYLAKNYFHGMWDGDEYNEGALVDITKAFYPNYE